MALSEAERTRLKKLVGMLGSAHDGEQLNAMGFIKRMAAEHKMTITELMGQVNGAAKEAPPRQPQPQRQPPWWTDGWPNGYWGRPQPPPPKPAPHPLPTEGLLGELVRNEEHSVLNKWERDFAHDVVRRYRHDRELSDKQLDCIHRILAKTREWDEREF